MTNQIQSRLVLLCHRLVAVNEVNSTLHGPLDVAPDAGVLACAVPAPTPMASSNAAMVSNPLRTLLMKTPPCPRPRSTRVMPLTVIFGSSLSVRSCFRWPSRVTSSGVAIRLLLLVVADDDVTFSDRR